MLSKKTKHNINSNSYYLYKLCNIIVINNILAIVRF